MGLSTHCHLRTATQLARDFKSIPGAVDVRIQQRFDAPQVKLEIDRARASSLGITPDEIVKNVVSSVSNSATYSPSIWIDPKTGIDYLFGVQFPENTIKTFADLLDIAITSPLQSRAVPLSWLAKTVPLKGPIELNHVNLEPVIDIFMDAQGRDIGGIARDAQRLMDKAKLPPGYKATDPR